MSSSPNTTYARARLTLGMSGVGLFVLLAVVLLFSELPERWLAGGPADAGADALRLASLFLVYALLQAPLDLAGGWVLPRRHGRAVGPGPRAVGRWLRAVVVQGAVLVASGLFMLSAGRALGAPGGWAAALVSMIALVAFQLRLARWVGGFGPSANAPRGLTDRVARAVGRPVPVRLWSAADEGFTGGWFGLPGRETLVLPARWWSELTVDELEAEVVHRAGALASGARTRGLAVALAFNGLGLALASQLPDAGFGSVSELLRTALGATLWSFLGLLLLPSLSRPAVLAADAFARREGVLAGALSRAIRRLDRWQDDEPRRTATVERIFHPVPSAEGRIAALLGEGSRPPSPGAGAWHAARMMLFLSWGGLGLLARAVHCNAGRPQLWVALPAD